MASTTNCNFTMNGAKSPVSVHTVVSDSEHSASSSASERHRHIPSRHIPSWHDEMGRQTFFLKLLIEGVGADHTPLLVGSVLSVEIWALVCAAVADKLRYLAETNPDGTAERWLDWIGDCKSPLAIVGTLFVFAMVFRFKECYNRWYESRRLWGDIISKSLELTLMNRNWITDEKLADKFSRFVVVFAYSSKSLVRGKSLGEEGEDGPDLVNRGLLTQEELDVFDEMPCWQPYFCIQVLRDILVEAFNTPKGKGICFDADHKVHGQLWRCFDNSLKDMAKYIGGCVTIYGSGLPMSYDALVMLGYYSFFGISSMVWAVLVGWMSPIIVFAASFLFMILIIMGTTLVDPFGHDKVDIPLESFCRQIESQVYAIDQRGLSGASRKLVKLN